MLRPTQPLSWAAANSTTGLRLPTGNAPLRFNQSNWKQEMFLANLLIDTGKVEQAVPLLRDAISSNRK